MAQTIHDARHSIVNGAAGMVEEATESAGTPEKPETEDQSIPVMQKVLDNPFLLLFLGVTIPTVLYIIWGVMEIAQIPIAP
ncbi:MAG: hypothetical protein QF609_04185 [Gammaproteobacteria bacterium]|jgi:hypothetical protein|nr:hypothetical protein [Gammaproteobacteria bacterium]|tara:strand:+ start:31 stop:273 length:243 start_codon:yes stop_codon:yes gene_type:complete